MTDDPSANNWDPRNPQSWNTYAYANGDPVNSNDPDGTDPVPIGPLQPVDQTQCVTVLNDWSETNYGIDAISYLNT